MILHWELYFASFPSRLQHCGNNYILYTCLMRDVDMYNVEKLNCPGIVYLYVHVSVRNKARVSRGSEESQQTKLQ